MPKGEANFVEPHRGAFKSRRAPPPPPRSKSRQPGLSLVAQFDDLVRNGSVLSEGSENEFIAYVKQSRQWIKMWKESEMQREQLAKRIKKMEKDLQAKEYKIQQARGIVEDERRGRLKAESERDAFAKQLDMLKEILLSENGRGFDNETLERVRHIDTKVHKFSPWKQNENHLPVLEESCASVLDVSDMSFDETKEDLGESRVQFTKNQQKKRQSSGRVEKANKRRKSRSLGASMAEGGKVLCTTTKVTVDGEGNAHAESIIEELPDDHTELKRMTRKSRESRGGFEKRVTYNDCNYQQNFSPSAPPCPPELQSDGKFGHKNVCDGPYSTPRPNVKRTFSNAGHILNRPHEWVRKKRQVMSKSERCGSCSARIGFRKDYLDCKGCGATVHIQSDCKNKIPLLCVPVGSRTPGNKGHGECLVDFAPLSPPRIPALIRHCVKEVEERGLEEVGIYRIPGNEADSNEVLNKFFYEKGAPNLAKYEIHVIASVMKKFLRSLKEPIIPQSLWQEFVDAASSPDLTDAESAMYQAVSELPQANRDTLAFLILHLQKVAISPQCKMDTDNLSKVWGPTIVGHSSNDPMALISEASLVASVVRTMLLINSDYWDNLLAYPVSTPRNIFPDLHTPEERTHFLPSALKSGGPIARRTRSRKADSSKNLASQMIFASPML